MTPDELKTAIALGREQRGTEFKGPGSRNDRAYFAKVIRAIFGMANKVDGGVVVLGVADNGSTLTPIGLSQAESATWNYDDLQAGISSYADPYVELNVEVIRLDGLEFIAIEVKEFTELPVLCKKDCEKILRRGALYVRARGKNETVEVPSHVEMREVIQRAALAVARNMIRNMERILPSARPSTDPFDLEAGDLL